MNKGGSQLNKKKLEVSVERGVSIEQLMSAEQGVRILIEQRVSTG